MQWWVIAATVAATPLAFSTWTFDVFNLTSLTVLWLGVIAAVGAEATLWGVRRMWLPRGWPVAAAFLAVLVITTATSRAPAVSFLGNYGRYGGLSTTAAIVVLALLLLWSVTGRPDRLRRLLVVIAVSGTLGAVYLWLQELGIDAFSWLEPWQRAPKHPSGVLGNSNFSGAHLAMATPPALVLATQGSGSRRVAWAGALILIVTGVAVSQSRGAMLATVVALIVVVAPVALRARRRLGAIVVSALMGGTVVAVVALAANEGGFTELSGTGTLEERVALWEVALEGFADRPLLGGGPDLYQLTFAEHAGASLDGVVSDEPHNVLLDHLDGSGLPGALAWLGVVAWIGVIAWRARGERMVTTFGAMGAAYLTQAMLSIDVVGLQLWGWVAAAGVLAAAHAPPPPSARRTAPVPGSPRLAVVVVATVAVVALAVVAVGPFRADMAHRRGVIAANGSDDQRSLVQLEQAVDRHGWEPVHHRRLGIQQVLAGRRTGDEALLASAATSLDRALELLPGDPISIEWRRTLGE